MPRDKCGNCDSALWISNEDGGYCQECGYEEMPCEREHDGDGWQCCHDHTGCIWNDGHNTCGHEGTSLNPLTDDEEADDES